MNVAVCISGIPRHYFCYDFIRRLSQWYKLHIFIYYWDDGQSIAKYTPRGCDVFPLNPESFRLPGCELFYQADTFQKYVPEFTELYKLACDNCWPDHMNRQDIGMFGMTYAIKKANEMREEFEQKNNMKFDCVMRARFETKFRWNEGPLANIKLSDYNMNLIYTPDININLKYGMNDCFAFSNSDIMSIYSNIHDFVVELSHIDGHHSETIFHLNLERHKIVRTHQVIIA